MCFERSHVYCTSPLRMHASVTYDPTPCGHHHPPPPVVCPLVFKGSSIAHGARLSANAQNGVWHKWSCVCLVMCNARYRRLSRVASGAGEEGGRVYRTGEAGLDRVEFLLAPGPAEPLQPLRGVASGGESSRVMLALKAAPAIAPPPPPPPEGAALAPLCAGHSHVAVQRPVTALDNSLHAVKVIVA